ncbi:MAG: ABC transporter ATP-binding protein [Acidaminobacteraceae bacterium]
MDKIFQVEDIVKTYQMGEVEVNALNGVSFEAYEGEFIVILGPSGSGKSTLLNIIGGMDKASSGRVLYRNMDLSNYSDKELTMFRRNNVGFVFQFYNLMANLTSKENIELATEICEDPLDIDKILLDVGLKHRADHFPSQLSGGEQQRVAIARAVAKNPDVLFCDEPTGALDFQTGLSILKLLCDINKNYNKTIIVITHNSSIANIGNRVIKMRSGKIIENYINENPVSPEGVGW